MPTITMVNRENQPAGELQLSDKVFAVKVNQHILWEAVQSYLANQRQGTSSTKTRGEVSGGGRKPWKQKGTGRARAGSNRSPLWYKGGIAFGPKPRDYSWELPKSQRRLALRTALTVKLADGTLTVLKELKLVGPKTKEMVGVLKQLNCPGRTTFVLGEKDDTLRLAGRNLKKLKLLNPNNLNTYDLLNCDRLLLTQSAVTKIEESLAK